MRNNGPIAASEATISTYSVSGSTLEKSLGNRFVIVSLRRRGYGIICAKRSLGALLRPIWPVTLRSRGVGGFETLNVPYLIFLVSSTSLSAYIKQNPV